MQSNSDPVLHLHLLVMIRWCSASGLYQWSIMDWTNIGDEEKVILLLKALIEKHIANNQDNTEKYEELKCMMLIVDHPNLVETLLSSIKGMENDWVNPSMSQDGESVLETVHTYRCFIPL